MEVKANTTIISHSKDKEEGEINSDDESCKNTLKIVQKQEFSWSDLNVLMVGDERILSLCWKGLQGYPSQELFYVTGGNTKSICSLVDRQISERHNIVIISGFHYDLCFYEFRHGKEMKIRDRTDFINIIDIVKSYSAKWKGKYPNKYFIWCMPYPVDFYQHNHHLNCCKGLFDDKEQIHLTEVYYSQVEILFNEINKIDISESYIFNVNELRCFKHIIHNLSNYLVNGLFPNKDICHVFAYYFVEFLYKNVFLAKNKCNINLKFAETQLIYLKNNIYPYIKKHLFVDEGSSNEFTNKMYLSDKDSSQELRKTTYFSDNSLRISIPNAADSIISNPLSTLSNYSSLSDISSTYSSRASSQEYSTSSHLDRPAPTYINFDLISSLLKGSKKSTHENEYKLSKHSSRSKSRTSPKYRKKSPLKSRTSYKYRSNSKSKSDIRHRSKSPRRSKSRRRSNAKQRSMRLGRTSYSRSRSSSRDRYTSHSTKNGIPYKRYKPETSSNNSSITPPPNKEVFSQAQVSEEKTEGVDIIETKESTPINTSTTTMPKHSIDSEMESDIRNKDEEIQFWKALKRLKEVHDVECNVFRNNPISHPQYAREKIKFFDDYYIAKTAESNRWNEFWMIHMEELFQEKWNSSKIQLSIEYSKIVKNNSGDTSPFGRNSSKLSRIKNEVEDANIEKRLKENYSQCFNNDILDKISTTANISAKPDPSNNIPYQNTIDEEIDFDLIMDDPLFKQGLDDIDIAIKTVFKGESSDVVSYGSCDSAEQTKSQPIFPCITNDCKNVLKSNTQNKELTGSDVNKGYNYENRNTNAEFLYILKMLSRLSKQLGSLGPSVSEIYLNAKTNYESANNALSALDLDAKIVLDLVGKKISNLLNKELSTIQRAIYGEVLERTNHFLKDLKFHSITFPKVDMKNIYITIKEKDITNAIEFIKNTLIYHGYFDFSKYDLMKIYQSVQDY